MISLKKYIESPQAELLQAALTSYRAGLTVMGKNAVEVCASYGSALLQSLTNLQESLVPETTPQQIAETERSIEAEIEQWGQRTGGQYRQNTREFKEILIVFARAAHLIGERDQRYAAQFHELTSRLESIAALDDLAEIHDCLAQSTVALKLCVESMAKDSAASLAQLRREVDTYQARLEQTEGLAGRDDLTGLDNRRKVESSIDFRLSRRQTFSILIFDLDGFKQVNEAYGHLAGDEALKQFAAEFRSAFRPLDVVGRWGGDEFIAVLDCGLDEAVEHAKRARQWVLGDYTIRLDGRQIRISLSASAGVATAQSDDAVSGLIARARRDRVA